jgi:hypothetical protein
VCMSVHTAYVHWNYGRFRPGDPTMLRIRKTLSEIIGPQPGERLKRLERAIIWKSP